MVIIIFVFPRQLGNMLIDAKLVFDSMITHSNLFAYEKKSCCDENSTFLTSSSEILKI